MKIKPVVTYNIKMDAEEAEALSEFIRYSLNEAYGNANPRSREVARQFNELLSQANPNPPF